MSFPSEKSEAMLNLQPLAGSRNACSPSKAQTLQDTLVPVLLPEMTSDHGSACASSDHSRVIYNRVIVASQTAKAKGRRVGFGRGIAAKIEIRRSECYRLQLALPCQAMGGIWGS